MLTPRKRSLTRNIKCGIHSGIPKCCIRFYIQIWHTIFEEQHINPIFKELVLAREKVWKQRKGIRGQYVECPSCIANNITPVIIRKCWLDTRTKHCYPLEWTTDFNRVYVRTRLINGVGVRQMLHVANGWTGREERMGI